MSHHLPFSFLMNDWSAYLLSIRNQNAVKHRRNNLKLRLKNNWLVFIVSSEIWIFSSDCKLSRKKGKKENGFGSFSSTGDRTWWSLARSPCHSLHREGLSLICLRVDLWFIISIIFSLIVNVAEIFVLSVSDNWRRAASVEKVRSHLCLINIFFPLQFVLILYHARQQCT